MSRSTQHLPDAIPTNRIPADDGVTKYRVREREDETKIYGQGLTPNEAYKLRDRVINTKQNQRRPLVIEPMPPRISLTDLTPAVAVADAADDLSVPEPPPLARESPIVGTEYKVASATRVTLSADGTVTEIPQGHQLLIDGQERVVPTRVQKGNVLECRSLAPPVVAARAAAADAVAAVIAAKRRIPMDVTVRQPAPRSAPPPPDKTVSNRPVTVRLGTPVAAPAKPPAAPQAVAEIVDDAEPLPDDALTDADLPDIAADLGGGASDADVEHARKQAEAERAG